LDEAERQRSDVHGLFAHPVVAASVANESGGGLFWLLPLLVYVCVALSNTVPYLINRGGTIVDAAGHRWRADDLRESSVVVMLLTMLFTSVLALLRWFSRRTAESAKPYRLRPRQIPDRP
ncbi:MAG: hypothetical protein M3Y41_03550, partial [Pseudomonadota bacterium]|nr:hypothetical protein [Pseudomonadota bacterium]